MMRVLHYQLGPGEMPKFCSDSPMRNWVSRKGWVDNRTRENNFIVKTCEVPTPKAKAWINTRLKKLFIDYGMIVLVVISSDERYSEIGMFWSSDDSHSSKWPDPIPGLPTLAGNPNVDLYGRNMRLDKEVYDYVKI